MLDGRFEAVVARHHGEIHRYLARTLTRRGDAEDLVQETFVRAFRAFATLPPDANIRAWLFTIATNVRRNHFRAERRRRAAYAALPMEERATDVDSPEDGMRLEQARDRLAAIVDRLPLKQRLAFTMRKLHGLDYEAIARSLECSTDSARAHVFQALRKIRLGLDLLPTPGLEHAR